MSGYAPLRQNFTLAASFGAKPSVMLAWQSICVPFAVPISPSSEVTLYCTVIYTIDCAVAAIQEFAS